MFWRGFPFTHKRQGFKSPTTNPNHQLRGAFCSFPQSVFQALGAADSWSSGSRSASTPPRRAMLRRTSFRPVALRQEPRRSGSAEGETFEKEGKSKGAPMSGCLRLLDFDSWLRVKTQEKTRLNGVATCLCSTASSTDRSSKQNAYLATC